MDQRNAFKYCPRCAHTLLKQAESLHCASCGFHFYINPAPTNAVLIENENNDILLVKRKVDPKKGFWDTAGGFINPNESIEDSVIREIKEELNVIVEMTGIIGIYPDEYYFQDINYSTLNILVKAKVISGTLSAMDDASEYRFFPKDKILDQQFAFAWIKKGLNDYLTQNR